MSDSRHASREAHSIIDYMRAHPVRAALWATPPVCFAFCVAIAQSWPSFTDKKIPDWVSEKWGWVFVKYPFWKIGLFVASILAAYVGVVYLLFRPRKGLQEQLLITVIRRWASPVLVTVINQSHDYQAHIKSGAIYGIASKKAVEKLSSVINWGAMKKLNCEQLPYSLAPDRQIQLGFAFNFETQKFTELFAELGKR